MVEAHCVADKGTIANQWLIVSDWFRVRTGLVIFVPYTVALSRSVE